MGKKSKSSQFSKHNKLQPTAAPTNSSQPIAPQPDSPLSVKYNPLGSSQSSSSSPPQNHSIKPEEMSLQAYGHIQECLNQRSHLSKKEVNAILLLSQHLRVFGLLSAVGYLNHGKDGEKKQYVKPMWMPLLWRLVCGDQEKGTERDLMVKVEQMAKNEPSLYMVTWRKSLIWSNHWNFWAKAHQQEEEPNASTEHSTVTG
jgi:hypothetical protein